MAGCYGCCTEVGSSMDKGIKLDFPIAEHVGIGGTPFLVFGKEVLHHPIPVRIAKINDMEFDVQFSGHELSYQHVVFVWAFAG